MSTKQYGYQASTADPTIWVFDGAICVGTFDPDTRKITFFASEEETTEMLSEALKRKPSKPS